MNNPERTISNRRSPVRFQTTEGQDCVTRQNNVTQHYINMHLIHTRKKNLQHIYHDQRELAWSSLADQRITSSLHHHYHHMHVMNCSPTHPPPSSPDVIILIYCFQAREWIQTTFGRQPASLDKNQILLEPHCEGRHFRTKLMSQYIGSGQKTV